MTPVTGKPRFEPSAFVWIGAAAVLGAYVAVLVRYSPLALQDYPTHLARARIIADLLFEHGAHFGAQFQFHWLAIPYVAGDLLTACAIEWLGVDRAAALWSVLVFLSLPAALLFYLSTTQIPRSAHALLILICAYLSTDWFFLMGFLEFRLGLAMTLVLLGVAEHVRRSPSAALFAAYALIATVGYLTHLAVLVFATVAVGTTTVVRLSQRRSRPGTEIGLLLPSALLLAWHFGFASAYRQPGDLVENGYVWGPWTAKVAGLATEFNRFHSHPDLVLFGLLLGALALYAGPVWRGVRLRAPALEYLLIAVVMIGLYAALPRGYSEAFYVDVRALPLAALFAILAVLAMARPQARGVSFALGAAAMLAALNLAYLTKHLDAHARWQARYREIVDAMPQGAHVLPVHASGREGHVIPTLYSYSFAIVDRDAVAPYVQTGDTGNPQKYVRYRNRPYAPEQFWYVRSGPPQVDWTRVGCAYEFILVDKPYDARRFPVPLEKVRENESAALLRLTPSIPARSDGVTPSCEQLAALAPVSRPHPGVNGPGGARRQRARS